MMLAKHTMDESRIPSLIISVLFVVSVFWVKDFLCTLLIRTKMIVPTEDIPPRIESPM